MLPFLMLLCGASAFDGSSRFHFSSQPRIFRRGELPCQMCYGNFDCTVLDKARCDYNADTDAIFDDVEEEEFVNDSIKKDVDTLMYDLMLKESLQEDFSECIPFVSTYTNCHRGNACTGCTRCECSSEAQWNCSVVQQCRHEAVAVNHRVLALVMENLRSEAIPDAHNRYKRSNAAEETMTSKVSPEQLVEWMYGGKYIPHNDVSEKPQALTKVNKTSSDQDTREFNVTTDPINDIKNETSKNLGFDDVLREIDVDFKVNESSGIVVIHKSNTSDIEHFLEMLAIEEGKDVTPRTLNDTTMGVIDLLNDNDNFGINAGYLINNNVKNKSDNYQIDDFDRDMDTIGFSNFVNVKKRAIGTSTRPVITRSTAITTAKTPAPNNTTNVTALETLLRTEVIDPVTKMIEDKHKEIELLTNLRNSLIKFSKVYNFNSSFYSESEFLNNYSLENDDTEISNFSRRKFSNGNAAALNKYMNKLKSDINEVIRDIIIIKKIQSSKVLSRDLKVLLQAIKYYMKSNKLKLKDNKRRKVRKMRRYNPRRQLGLVDFNLNVNYIKEALTYMLEVIDRDMPLKNALSPLSPGAKKLFKRVINNNYVDDSAVIGFRIHDPNYDMATDLKNTAIVDWHELTASIADGAPADRLYSMLLLHFRLCQQTKKLADALALLKFTNSRRMSGIEENVGIEILEGINTNLNTINYEIKHYINNKHGKKQKMSLLKKIKQLLSNSKNNMLKIVRKKQTSPIDVELIKKKIEEKNKLELKNVLKGWEDNFLAPHRKKRSLMDIYGKEHGNKKNRMKNIIPLYLRGKLDPALKIKTKGIKKKINSYAGKPKHQYPVHSKNNILSSTAKTKSTTTRLNKIKLRH